jgi:hypothetical protein
MMVDAVTILLVLMLLLLVALVVTLSVVALRSWRRQTGLRLPSFSIITGKWSDEIPGGSTQEQQDAPDSTD